MMKRRTNDEETTVGIGSDDFIAKIGFNQIVHLLLSNIVLSFSFFTLIFKHRKYTVYHLVLLSRTCDTFLFVIKNIHLRISLFHSIFFTRCHFYLLRPLIFTVYLKCMSWNLRKINLHVLLEHCTNSRGVIYQRASLRWESVF